MLRKLKRTVSVQKSQKQSGAEVCKTWCFGGKRHVFLLFVEKCSILFHHFPYRVRQYSYCVSRSNKDVRGLPYCILKHPYWMG